VLPDGERRQAARRRPVLLKTTPVATSSLLSDKHRPAAMHRVGVDHAGEGRQRPLQNGKCPILAHAVWTPKLNRRVTLNHSLTVKKTPASERAMFRKRSHSAAGAPKKHVSPLTCRSCFRKSRGTKTSRGGISREDQSSGFCETPTTSRLKNA
jgi:hypothetical protein